MKNFIENNLELFCILQKFPNLTSIMTLNNFLNNKDFSFKTNVLYSSLYFSCINSKHVFMLEYEVQTRKSQEMRSMRVDHRKSI